MENKTLTLEDEKEEAIKELERTIEKIDKVEKEYLEIKDIPLGSPKQ